MNNNMKLSFDYLKKELLAYKATSFLKQGSIVILRSIFEAAEEKSRAHNTASLKEALKILDAVVEKENRGSLTNEFIRLADRWQDEQKYEDIKDYEKHLKKIIGVVKIVDISPFTAMFTLKKTKYFIRKKGRSIVWGRMGGS